MRYLIGTKVYDEIGDRIEKPEGTLEVRISDETCDDCYYKSVSCDHIMCTAENRRDNVDIIYKLIDISEEG